MRLEVVPRYSQLLNYDHSVYRAPTAFSSRDHCSMMDVSELGQRLLYIGSGHGDVDAATARSENDIPPQCGVFYFEVTITDKGRDGFFSIGVITKASLLKKLVGWETGTIGYHGDDGCVYMGSGKGHAFGPTYTLGDVVGCGVNFTKKHVFFTKNGIYLGEKNYPLSSSNDPLYAAFGMKSPGEAARANFGLESFAFDIEGYIKSQQDIFQKEAIKTVEENVNYDMVLPILILKHLVHVGCEKTTLAFYRSAFGDFMPGNGITEESLKHMLQRSRLRRSLIDFVLHGEISVCIDAVQREYPELLANDVEVDFLLHCQLFVELVSHLKSISSPDLTEIFRVGQGLEEKVAKIGNRELHEMAKDALALIAYKNIQDSPSAYLIQESHCQMIASQLEDALLRFDEMSVYSPLEKLIRSYQVSLELLGEAGDIRVPLVPQIHEVLRSSSFKSE